MNEKQAGTSHRADLQRKFRRNYAATQNLKTFPCLG